MTFNSFLIYYLEFTVIIIYFKGNLLFEGLSGFDFLSENVPVEPRGN